MPELGQIAGQELVGDGLAVDEDPIVVEDHEVIAHAPDPRGLRQTVSYLKTPENAEALELWKPCHKSPERRKPPCPRHGGFPKNCSAASYSPTGSPLQYHRRCKA